MGDAVTTHECISALADGQLQDSEFARAVELATSDSGAQERWQTYHLIGDVLRSGELARANDDAAFLARLRPHLMDGSMRPSTATTDSAPFAIAVNPSRTGAGGLKDVEFRPAANSSHFAWKMVAGLASVAAVAAIGWTTLSPGAGPVLAAAPGGAQLAAAPADGAGGAVLIRDRRLDELLRAHSQVGGSSALQTPSGFLRNATYDAPSR